jgi:hypothetical protein
MTITINKVVKSDITLNDLLRKCCEAVANNGGSFSVNSEYETGTCWFTTYVINWPESKKVEPARTQYAGTYGDFIAGVSPPVTKSKFED